MLARIFESEYADQFILKGAMLFALWKKEQIHRETQDLDLLWCYGTYEEDALIKVFHKISQVAPTQPDGLTFETGSLKAKPIREEDVYGGMRIHITASLDTARIPLQIDVGFGDRQRRQETQIRIAHSVENEAILTFSKSCPTFFASLLLRFQRGLSTAPCAARSFSVAIN